MLVFGLVAVLAPLGKEMLEPGFVGDPLLHGIPYQRIKLTDGHGLPDACPIPGMARTEIDPHFVLYVACPVRDSMPRRYEEQ